MKYQLSYTDDGYLMVSFHSTLAAAALVANVLNNAPRVSSVTISTCVTPAALAQSARVTTHEPWSEHVQPGPHEMVRGVPRAVMTCRFICKGCVRPQYCGYIGQCAGEM